MVGVSGDLCVFFEVLGRYEMWKMDLREVRQAAFGDLFAIQFADAVVFDGSSVGRIEMVQ